MAENEVRMDPTLRMLMEKAMKGENNEFEFIKNLQERSVAKTLLHGTKLIVRHFRLLEKSSEAVYNELIKEGKQSPDALLWCMQFKQCVKFYQKEADILKDMLKEYHAYVFGGNVIKTLLGINRRKEELVDYRKLPLRLF